MFTKCKFKKWSWQTYLRSTIFWYSILERSPRDLAWIPVNILDSRSSRISSNCPNRPALKNTWKYIYLIISNFYWSSFERKSKLNSIQLKSNSNVYLSVPKSVLLDIYVKRSQQFFSPLLAVNELSLWDCRWVKDAVSAKLHEKVLINITSASLLHNNVIMSVLLRLYSSTSVWNHHKGFYWGNPSCRSWYLLAHHCSEADA